MPARINFPLSTPSTPDSTGPRPSFRRDHRQPGGQRRRSAEALLAGVLAASALTGCAAAELLDAAEEVERAWEEQANASAPGEATVALLSPDAAARALDALPGVERTPADVPTYRRDAFGSAWADVDRNGCNQRDDVLLRDAVPDSVVTAAQGRCDHDVLAGRWIDPYSGVEVDLDDLKDRSQAQAVQIDHVVPLAEAWRSGAWGWTPDRRREYANALPVLVATDGPTNSSKSDGDPAAWRPRKPFQCSYALRWVTVKDEWRLAVDDSERRALEEMLALC